MLYKRSVIAIKTAEDKTHRGAVVASLVIPWGSKAPFSKKTDTTLSVGKESVFLGYCNARCR